MAFNTLLDGEPLGTSSKDYAQAKPQHTLQDFDSHSTISSQIPKTVHWQLRNSVKSRDPQTQQRTFNSGGQLEYYRFLQISSKARKQFPSRMLSLFISKFQNSQPQNIKSFRYTNQAPNHIPGTSKQESPPPPPLPSQPATSPHPGIPTRTLGAQTSSCRSAN